MNHILFDLLPVFLFFIAFKYYGIYAATWVGIIATVVQTFSSRILKKKWDKMQVTTMLVFCVFGGMTLYFHNPIFVKWKPSIVFWVFATILLGSQIFAAKPLVHSLLEAAMRAEGKSSVLIIIPDRVGKILNLAWALFFLTMGCINLYIAYGFDDAVWVNFKLYGLTGATMGFSVVQTVYLLRHMKG